jgi:2-(1,2-epoxy-1,2-dihydrophenyl)acetyl-CoA isomerase
MNSVLFEKKGQLAVITLNRPEKYNAFNRDMALLLQKLLDECSVDDSIRAVYLSGAGKAFCSGQDLAEVSGPAAIPIKTILSEHYNPIVSRLRQIPKPVVCAVNGVAAGAGANIALACDVVVAHESASFIQAFSKIGLIPDSGGTYTLPRLIGFQRASALMMLGDKVSAAEAERMGMVYRVYAAGEFAASSIALAETLAAMPTKGLAYTKEALNKALNHTLAQQLELEAQLQIAAAQTADHAEGVAAFMEKRAPVFTGK